jgi:predicted DNA-binding protein (UPF0251 family)
VGLHLIELLASKLKNIAETLQSTLLSSNISLVPEALPTSNLERIKELLRKLPEIKEEKSKNLHAKENIPSISCTDKLWQSILAPCSVILIVGKRGSGKSALGFLLLEKLSCSMKCYVLNLPKEVHNLLPANIGVVSNLEDVPVRSAILIDEAALQFPARSSSCEKNRRLLNITSLARQREQTIIFISQDTTYIDINILRALSTLIIKEPAPLQSKFERHQIKEFIDKAKRAFDKIKGDKRRWAYIAFSPNGYEGLIEVSKPSFFTNKLSRCYACFNKDVEEKTPQVLSKEEKKEKAYMLYTKEALSIRQIAHYLGVSKSTIHNWIKERKEKDRANILEGPAWTNMEK